MISLLLCLWAGHWLDTLTGFSPWFTVGGMFAGLALGMGLLYKMSLRVPPPVKKITPPDSEKAP